MTSPPCTSYTVSVCVSLLYNSVTVCGCRKCWKRRILPHMTSESCRFTDVGTGFYESGIHNLSHCGSLWYRYAIFNVLHKVGLGNFVLIFTFHTHFTFTIGFLSQETPVKVNLKQLSCARITINFSDKNSEDGKKSGDNSRKQFTTTTKKPTTRVAMRTTRSWLRETHTLQPHHRHPDPRYPDHRYPPQAPISPPGNPNICEGHFDAVSFLRGELFVFKDDVSSHCYVKRFMTVPLDAESHRKLTLS